MVMETMSRSGGISGRMSVCVWRCGGVGRILECMGEGGAVAKLCVETIQRDDVH